MNCLKNPCLSKCFGYVPLSAGVCILLCLYMIPPFILLFYSMNTTYLYMVASLFYLIVKVAVTSLYMGGLCVKKSVLCVPYLLYFFLSVLISRLLGILIELHKQSSDDHKQKSVFYGLIVLFVLFLPLDVYFFMCIYSLYLKRKKQEKGHE